MVLYKDDNIEITKVGKEIYINYYRAGQWLGEMKTNNMYDYDLATLELSR